METQAPTTWNDQLLAWFEEDTKAMLELDHTFYATMIIFHDGEDPHYQVLFKTSKSQFARQVVHVTTEWNGHRHAVLTAISTLQQRPRVGLKIASWVPGQKLVCRV